MCYRSNSQPLTSQSVVAFSTAKKSAYTEPSQKNDTIAPLESLSTLLDKQQQEALLDWQEFQKVEPMISTSFEWVAQPTKTEDDMLADSHDSFQELQDSILSWSEGDNAKQSCINDMLLQQQQQQQRQQQQYPKLPTAAPTTKAIERAQAKKASIKMKQQAQPSINYIHVIEPSCGLAFTNDISFEEFKTAKRERNRLSAEKCRHKRRDLIEALKILVEELTTENDALRLSVANMSEQLKTPRSQHN